MDYLTLRGRILSKTLEAVSSDCDVSVVYVAFKKQRLERLRWKREGAARERRAEAERRRRAESEAADAWQTSNRIRDFAAAVSKAGESYECSSNQGGDIQRLAKWARGYAQRLDPINRIGETVAEFKDLRNSD
jgi:uncharacterized protein with von Willebrand factor type A (vWA) domain